MADSSSYFNIYRAAEQQRQGELPWIIGLIRALLIILFSTLLIDIGIVMFLPDGLQLLKDTFDTEVQYLSRNLDARSTDFITGWVNQAYEWVFVRTGLHDVLHSKGNAFTSSLVSGMWPIIQGAMIGFQVFMIRLTVIVLMMPFLALISIVAASDGFLGWYRRRTGAARESAFIYHRSKRMVAWSIFGLWFFYLVPPFDIDPVYIFLPTTVLLGTFIRFSVQYFKKYI
jgi:integrating conjugative element membrane protein (TIGR03747 family)